VKDVKYVALPAAVYDLAKQRFAKPTTGSMFTGGSQVGVKLDEVMKGQ
jgi:phosphate transport system substrate-binding protein